MDIEEAIQRGKQLEALWDLLPKSAVTAKSKRKIHYFTLAFLLMGRLKVILRVALGPKGGVREEICVVDTRARLETDRLITDTTNAMGEVVALLALRESMKRGEASPEALCREALIEAMQRTERDPARFEAHARALGRQEGMSIITISGGLPNLGRK